MDGTSLVAPHSGSVSTGQWRIFTIILNCLQHVSLQSCQKWQIWHVLSTARQKFSCLICLTSKGCVSETHGKALSSDSYVLIGKSSLSWVRRQLASRSQLPQSMTYVKITAAPRRCSCTARFVPSMVRGLVTPLQAEAPLRAPDPKMLQACPGPFSHLNLPL